jgi:hypothetical protein
VLIQRKLYKEDRRPAFAKGVVAAVLTAIPAPLSSLGLLPLAAFGAVKVLFPDRSSETTALELQTGQDIVRS